MRIRWLILTILFFAIAAAAAPKCAPVPVMNQEELHAWYRQYNKEYFSNKLPEDIVFQWVDMHDRKRMGETDCSSYPCVIRLDPGYNEAFPVAKATILHELCHLSTPDELDHGPKWHACMTRLWLNGAFDGLI